MACVEAIGQTESVLCLCCSRTFLKAELPGHVTSNHFGFLPFACTSCDFTAASERDVLEHAKEKRHLPYAVDHSSSRPYLSLLIRLVISHCKTFAQTDDFAAILAELNSQISVHENGFIGIKSQPELAFIENPQDCESSSERSPSTPNSTVQNTNLRLLHPQRDGPSADLSTPTVKPTRKSKLPKQPSPQLAARQFSERMAEQGSSSNITVNASATCALCASDEQFSDHDEKKGHVLQHLGHGGATSGNDHQNPAAFFTEIAAIWQRCFPAPGEHAGTEMPAALEGAAKRQSHVSGGLAQDLSSFMAQQNELVLSKLRPSVPISEETASGEKSSKERRYPARRRSSLMKNPASFVARNELSSPTEAVSMDRRSKRNVSNALESMDETCPVEAKSPLFCRLCDLVLQKGRNAVSHVRRVHMDDHKQFSCSVCQAANNWPCNLRANCRLKHPDVEPIIKKSSADVSKVFAARYRQCFAKNSKNFSSARVRKGPGGPALSRASSGSMHNAKPRGESRSGRASSSHHHDSVVEHHDNNDAVALANAYECQVCSALVTVKPGALKYHAIISHLSVPQKVFECSQCGYGNNAWRCYVIGHVRRVHRGETGKGVRVIDRSKKFANRIRACLRSCFPEVVFAVKGVEKCNDRYHGSSALAALPSSKAGASKNGGYHYHSTSELAADYSSENSTSQIDLPGPSGYEGPELGTLQELEGSEQPPVDGFDDEEGFVDVVVKTEQINDPIVAISFRDKAAASAFR